LPWLPRKISPSHNTDLRGTHRWLLKIAAFAHSDSHGRHDCDDPDQA
jgi:hypothetical protein